MEFNSDDEERSLNKNKLVSGNRSMMERRSESRSTLDRRSDSSDSERLPDSLDDQGVPDSGVGSSSEKTSTVNPNFSGKKLYFFYTLFYLNTLLTSPK
jgi:hypothetical protein